MHDARAARAGGRCARRCPVINRRLKARRAGVSAALPPVDQEARRQLEINS
jgi:hypothetical protein